MRQKGIVKFLNKFHVCNISVTKSDYQRWCYNIETKEFFWLKFTKSSKLYNNI